MQYLDDLTKTLEAQDRKLAQKMDVAYQDVSRVLMQHYRSMNPADLAGVAKAKAIREVAPSNLPQVVQPKREEFSLYKPSKRTREYLNAQGANIQPGVIYGRVVGGYE